MIIDMSKLFVNTGVNDLGLHSRSQGYKNARTCAIIPFSKWHEVAQTLVVVRFVREMTADKSSKYGKYEPVEHLI